MEGIPGMHYASNSGIFLWSSFRGWGRKEVEGHGVEKAVRCDLGNHVTTGPRQRCLLRPKETGAVSPSSDIE